MWEAENSNTVPLVVTHWFVFIHRSFREIQEVGRDTEIRAHEAGKEPLIVLGAVVNSKFDSHVVNTYLDGWNCRP